LTAFTEDKYLTAVTSENNVKLKSLHKEWLMDYYQHVSCEGKKQNSFTPKGGEPTCTVDTVTV